MSVITFKTPKSIRKYIPSQRGNSRAEYYISIPSLNKMTKLLESVPKLKDMAKIHATKYNDVCLAGRLTPLINF